jgi:very-short-patch-repair endonuclease
MATAIPAELLRRPFTWAEASAVGVTKHQLQSSRFRHVFRDVWVCSDLPDDRETRFAAARLVLRPRAVLCMLTAAWLYGADVRRVGDLDVHASYPSGARTRPRAGVVVTQETLAAEDILVIDGIRVTTPVRTAFDCLRLLRDPEGVVAADALTHLGRTTVDELRGYFAGQRRLRNLRIGERLLDDVDPSSESPMESRLRVRLVRSGLPRPVAQWDVYDDFGRFVARLDLAWPDAKVAVEYDGAWHWTQRRHDDRRRDRLRELGWTVIVVSGDDLADRTDAFVSRVARALRRAAA